MKKNLSSDMFDILFGWRKASKCKNLVRRVQCRLKLLKIKRDSIVSQLRDGIAHLLNNGHFDSAFSRVEQLFKDQSLLAAYDLLDHFCEFIIIHFPYIRKHKDCPNDINEAVSTLMFAAAWCGDLPELKMIQKLFSERYGHKFAKAAIGIYPGNLVNNQIREKLCIKAIPENAKVRLIDEIAKEYSLLNLSKLCGNNDCQWEGFVFNEEPDELTERPVKLIVEPPRVTPMHKSATKMENSNVVGSFYQPEMKLSTFSMEDSIQFHSGTVKFEEVQEFRFCAVQDACDGDKRKFLFFDSSILPLGDCSTIGGGSFLFLSSYDYGEHETDRPGSRNEMVSLRKARIKSNGKTWKGIESKESELYRSCSSPVLMVNCIECGQDYEIFFKLSENEKSYCHQYGLPSRKCKFKHRKSYCRCRFSEDIELNCSLEHPRYHSVRKIHTENPIASCTSSRGSHSHVHPKLPDYDEVAAKFMALKKEHQQKTGAGSQG